MKIKIETIWSSVVEATNPEKTWLKEFLVMENADGYYTGEKLISLLGTFDLKFLTGFLPLVYKGALQRGFEVHCLDLRTKAIKHDSDFDLSFLRDYQIDSFNSVIKRRRGILHLPTAAGKTHIASALMLAIPCRWIFLAHRMRFVMQAHDRISEFSDIPLGIIGDGKDTSSLETRIVFATFDTLYSGLKRKKTHLALEKAEGIICDEAHTIPAKTFAAVVKKAHNANYRVGLSGTPLDRTDKRSIFVIGLLGPIIHRVKATSLIEKDVIVKPDIKLLPVFQTAKISSWAEVYSKLVVRSEKRNQAILYAGKIATKPAMLFVQHIPHGHELVKKFDLIGINSKFLYGIHSDKSRLSAIRDLESGRLDLIITNQIFQEGIDIPQLRSVIIAAGGKSVIAALQRIGRGMRKTDDKTSFEVFDIKDQGQRWLEMHTKKRIDAYLREGYAVSTLGISL